MAERTSPIPGAAVRAAAEVLLRFWNNPVEDETVMAADFADEAREVLAAALPHLTAEVVAAARRKRSGIVINFGPPPEPTVRYVPIPVYRGPGGWRRA